MFRRRLLPVLAAALALASGSVAGLPATRPSAPDPFAQNLARYVEEARAIVAALDAGEPPASQARALEVLAERAFFLVEPFSQIHPACRDYLQAAAGLRDTWSQLVPGQIEARYHRDASLPAITDARDRDRCYQMKDLLVHPLTARRLLDEAPVDSATIRHELLEVIAHAGVLQVMTGG